MTIFERTLTHHLDSFHERNTGYLVLADTNHVRGGFGGRLEKSVDGFNTLERWLERKFVIVETTEIKLFLTRILS